MHADCSDWHNPKVASALGLHILAFSQVWNESSSIWWNIAVLHWHVETKCPWVSSPHLLAVHCLHWISVETHTKNALLLQCSIFLSAAGSWLTFWNCQTGSKTGFPLVPPYLIISDSRIAFHFHCVNPGNPSAPNDQLVTQQQRYFVCLGLELSLASTYKC